MQIWGFSGSILDAIQHPMYPQISSYIMGWSGMVIRAVSYENRAILGYYRKVWEVNMVPGKGIEPPLSYLNQILSLARLPVPPPRHGDKAGKYK